MYLVGDVGVKCLQHKLKSCLNSCYATHTCLMKYLVENSFIANVFIGSDKWNVLINDLRSLVMLILLLEIYNLDNKFQSSSIKK